MKKEWLLAALMALVTLVLALGVVRWLAPGLLGIPVDLRVVRVSEAVPAFFDNVFRPEDREGEGLILNDPVTATRHRPLVAEANLMGEAGTLFGPTDLLGFRNRAVPVVADVVTIGDSQTFGSNVPMADNWPSRLAGMAGGPVLYNMSVGGWGAIQYQDLFGKALALGPRVVVVAFYTGNDPAESVRLAYEFERWADFRPAPEKPGPVPSHWPPTDGEMWRVRFGDGVETVFTAAARLMSNDRDQAATGAGYAIMAEAARRMAERAAREGAWVVFTIIPTKETAHADKVAAEGLDAPADYRRLVAHEAQNTAALAGVLEGLPNATYVDLVTALQQAALGPRPLYPPGPDGHPVGSGYHVIARALSGAVMAHLPAPPAPGLHAVRVPGKDALALVLLRDGGVWFFGSPDVAAANGWTRSADSAPLNVRDIAQLPLRGVIKAVDPARFGP
ncbi:MAG: hypothetical protein HZA24_02070 [Nitrospirae bacterium]|nr:hypothetical protein [Nitrospirota bacterium]